MVVSLFAVIVMKLGLAVMVVVTIVIPTQVRIVLVDCLIVLMQSLIFFVLVFANDIELPAYCSE